MMNIKNLIIVLVLITWMSASILYFSPPTFSVKLITVPGDFSSIQAAIDAAQSGEKILVRSGIYNECLVINKPLAIVGEEGATIIGGESHTVDIRSNNVCFCGFILTGDVNKPWSGVYIFYSSFCTIENNTIMNHRYGIQIYDSSQITLRNNRLLGNRYNLEVWGLLPNHFRHQIYSDNLVNQKKVYYLIDKTEEQVPLDAGYVALVNCSNVIIRDVELTSNGAGVLVAYSSGCIISNVTARGNIRGMRVLSSQDNIIKNCNLSENEWAGLVLEASMNNFIQSCLIKKNVMGIFVSESSILKKVSEDNVVFNNCISQNTYGIWLYFSDDNVFQGNKIIDNMKGISIDASRDNLFYHNFVDNKQVEVEIKDAYSRNRWDFGYFLGGNFWGGYEEVDFKSGVFQNETGADGIGDIKYVINENNCDNFPLMGGVSNYEVVLGNVAFSMCVITNSTIMDFGLDSTRRTMRFNIVVSNGTYSFFKWVISKSLIADFFGNKCKILIDGKEIVGFNYWEDSDFSYIYLVHEHPFQKIEIVSELPSSVLVQLFFYSAFLSIIFFFVTFSLVKKSTLKKRREKSLSSDTQFWV